MSNSNSDWKRRRLCSDGNCIGVIGEDGRCRECGLAGEGDSADGTLDPVSAQTVPGAPVSPEAESQPASDETADGTDDEWERRTLCIDESCIGVVGPDDRCKLCGKPYPRSP